MDELDKETGMDILTPILAKHTTLWGLGVVKDTVDNSYATGSTQLPDVSLQSSQINMCPQCGYMAMENPYVPDDYKQQVAGQGPITCPTCGVQMQSESLMEPQAGDVQQFPTGKLCSEVVPILEIYLPRDCRDPNLSPVIIHRFRRAKNRAHHLFPDAGELPQDDKRDLPQFY